MSSMTSAKGVPAGEEADPSVLEKSYRETKFNYKGVIAFCGLQDNYIYYPKDGFEGTGTLDEQITVDLDVYELAPTERRKTVTLKFLNDDPGVYSRIFLRVEEGCEQEYIDIVVGYMNGKLGDQPKEEKEHRYNLHIPLHRDAMRQKWKYQQRNMPNQEWPHEYRHRRGKDIKYQSDVIINAPRTALMSPTRSVSTTFSAMAKPSAIFKEPSDTVKASDIKKYIDEVAQENAAEEAMKAKFHKKKSVGKAKSPEAAVTAPPKQSAAGSSSDPVASTSTDVGARIAALLGEKADEDKSSKKSDKPLTKAEKAFRDFSPKTVAEIPPAKGDIPTFVTFMVRYRELENDVLEESGQEMEYPVTTTKNLTVKERTALYTHVKKAVNKTLQEEKKAKAEKAKEERAAAKQAKQEKDEKAKAISKREVARLEEKKKEESKAKLKSLEGGGAADDDGDDINLESVTLETELGGAKVVDKDDSNVEKSAEVGGGSTVSPDETAKKRSPPGRLRETPKKRRKRTDSSSEELYAATPSTSRAAPAEHVSLKASTRRSKVPLEDMDWQDRFGRYERSLESTNNKLDDMSEELERKHKSFMAYRKETNDNVVKIFELMVALESVVSHNKKQHILDVAGVKAKITKMLPLNTVCEDVDMLFVNTNCQRVLGDYLQDKLIGRGLKEPTERDVALRAIKAFFSSYMRAHMVVGNPDFKSNTADIGWDKVRIPQSFLDFFESHCMALVHTAASPFKAASGGWKTIMINHCNNVRTSYFCFLGRDDRTLYDWIVTRYNDKVEFRNDHFCDIREGRNPDIFGLEDELKLFVKKNKLSSIDDLKETRPTGRVQKNFFIKIGDSLEPSTIREAMFELHALNYADPFPAGPSMTAQAEGPATAVGLRASALKDVLQVQADEQDKQFKKKVVVFSTPEKMKKSLKIGGHDDDSEDSDNECEDEEQEAGDDDDDKRSRSSKASKSSRGSTKTGEKTREEPDA